MQGYSNYRDRQGSVPPSMGTHAGRSAYAPQAAMPEDPMHEAYEGGEDDEDDPLRAIILAMLQRRAEGA